jgi:hypothetical protein
MLTATVTPGVSTSDTLTGSVVFTEDGTFLATVPVNGGTAVFTVSTMTQGQHVFGASYTGDDNHTASSSSAVTVTVGTSNQLFVSQLYQSLLQRQPDVGGLAFWSSMLDQGMSRMQVALGIEQSQEWRADQVQALYQQFLHRDADPSGLATYVNFLGAGGTLEQLKIILTSSPEYFQMQGNGTDAGFLNAIYQDALNRAPDAPGLAGFMQAMNMGTTPQQVATAIFGSTEYVQDEVSGFYQQYLKRGPDAGGLMGFVQALKAGVSEQDIIAVMLGSNEFFGMATAV